MGKEKTRPEEEGDPKWHGYNGEPDEKDNGNFNGNRRGYRDI